MSESSKIFVGLDQHKESIAVAHVGADRALEPIYLGPIGTRTSEVDAMVRKLQSKAKKLVCKTSPYPDVRFSPPASIFMMRALQSVRG